jgi:hypothetical protein
MKLAGDAAVDLGPFSAGSSASEAEEPAGEGAVGVRVGAALEPSQVLLDIAPSEPADSSAGNLPAAPRAFGTVLGSNFGNGAQTASLQGEPASIKRGPGRPKKGLLLFIST